MVIDIKTGTLLEVSELITDIPELNHPSSPELLQERIKDSNSLILIASINNQAIGFKLGYELNSNNFYSWLGGVVPNYRQQGVAHTLRERQEEWARAKQYQCILVKSKNCFPNMLKMLISSGYQICAYENKGNINDNKIHFIKYL